MTDSESDDDLLICDQCCEIVDETQSPSFNHKWIHSEEEGYGVSFNFKLFCNPNCLDLYQRGRMPTKPTEQIAEYREKKTRRLRQDLLVYQAHDRYKQQRFEYAGKLGTPMAPTV